MVKHFARGFRIILLLFLLLVAYAVIWLQGGTRDIDWANGRLTDALNPAGAPYTISIGKVSLRWQRLTEFGDVRVKGMQLSRKDGGIFATIPEVNVTLDPLGFLPHRRAIHGLKIDRPRLYLTRDETGTLRLGVEGMPETLAVNEFTGFFASDEKEAESSRRRMPFRELEVNDASLLFTDEASGGILKSDHLSFDIGREGRDLHGGLSMPFTWREAPGSIDAGIITQANGRQLNARLEQVPSELACLLVPCPTDIQFNGAVSGKVTLNQQPRQPISAGSIALNTENATLTAPELFAETLEFKKASITGSGSEGFTKLRVDNVTLALKDTNIAGKAALQKREDGWYAQGDASCDKLKISKLYKYWPLALATDSRAWVTGQLSKGYAESGTLKFDITPADTGDSIRDEAIAATVLARNLTVDYIPGFPPITEASGTAHFTGKQISIDVDSGKLLTGSVIKPSKVAFTNLDIPATPMETTLTLTAPAKDVATILKLPPFTFDDAVNLDPATIAGSADATIKLAFNAFSKDAPGSGGQIDFSGIGYDVDATLMDVAQADLVDGRDISGFNGTVKANAEGAKLAGTVKVDGTNADITLTDGPSESDTVLAVKGTIATAQFAELGIEPMTQIGEGSVGVDAEIMLGKDSQTLKRARLDLTGVPLTLEEISWTKPAGTATSLAIDPGDAARSYSMKLEAPGLSIGNATFTLNEAMDDVERAVLPAVKTEKNNFALNYATKPGGYAITLTGETLDISDSYAGEPTETPAQEPPEEKKEPSLLADFPALDLKVDLQKLVLVSQYPLTEVKGTLRCDEKRCDSADLTAKTGDGDLSATIGSVNGARQLTITNSNAGAFLRAVDISDRVYDGKFSLTGTYDDTKNPAPLSGRVQINDFKLKNSEILARIISIGSLSGLVNVLTGSGIDFNKFATNFGALGGVFNITKGRAESTALGITVEGSLDTNASQVNLKGVVVPANILNSLIGKIPLIGKLAGGEGEGLIAFNYSVKGSMADPDVFVNPLSGLTPGILRGIFTAGDKQVPAVPEATTPAPTVPAEETPQQPVPWPSEKNRR